ncbi:rhodanese-like domain-containing protein [Flexivirga sp. ID2601S]|uniref:Rhodanese-like domain-containing protein n=1 Tax=Flexivirga aerilata TaxID=1656889 RepID=A0A849AMQ5_9MICO|nr:rhodanese-like domain-containing protein [Flexivirga aerilata]NNG40588.1 rhodanese-like domain-containing protein [Flexivirga aerilata]
MSYAGDVTPQQAYDALRDDPDAVLVDVRTQAEWTYVGVPDLSPIGKRVVCVEWQDFPAGAQNARFVDDVREANAAGGAVYLLCRSGARSVAAAEALSAAGVGPAYNVVDGFEGNLDEHGHRALAGWKVAGLPWRQ